MNDNEPSLGRFWAVVVPVKPPERGKTRLSGPDIDRRALARAIALDTIAAAAACDAVAEVVVVTDDGGLPLAASGIPGLRFVAEGASRGLDGAIAAAVGETDRRMPRAALLGDLPALRPDDLADALRQAASVDRAVVADAEGTGSTLVTANAGVAWTSAFGAGSFARHVALGCVPLDAAESLRRDVDTLAHLEAAASQGLGERTVAVLAAHDTSR